MKNKLITIIKNPMVTIPLFVISMIMTWYRGVTSGVFAPQMWLKQYFDQEADSVWVNFTSTLLDAINAPIGTIIMLTLAYSLFLWLFFIMSGVRKEYKFIDFLMPMLSVSMIGVAFGFIDLAVDFHFGTTIRVILTALILAFYCAVAVKLFDAKIHRSVIAVVTAFVATFLFGGYSVVAPFFHWM
ncbi:hypothetical protein [Mariprofundus ferrooxydans]|uniref:hypothetical protein n=1 Tax=Mariprofundus ferrooxydans TaxID=314344 RepID=UPI0003791AF2|nr:hypothetical protein [Mariprofundus ferrooxydans]